MLLSYVYKQVEACWAHNPEVRKSNLRSSSMITIGILACKEAETAYNTPST